MLRFIIKYGEKREKADPFPYIICWGLSRKYLKNKYFTRKVSVHYMLRFIGVARLSGFFLVAVSVHYMLRFIFNPVAHVGVLSLFPYIICWGLSFTMVRGQHARHQFPYIICWGLSCAKIGHKRGSLDVSVHYMLRFILYSWQCWPKKILCFRTLYVEVYLIVSCSLHV